KRREVPILVVVGARGLGAAIERDRMAHEVKQLMSDHDVTYSIQEDDGESDIAEVICDLAADNDAELIVIGLRRRSPVGKLILGSSAERRLVDAHCPVLAVKAEGDSYAR